MATRVRAPKPLTSLPSSAGAVISIDVSDLERIAENMKAAKIAMNFALQSKLTRAANVYASELAQAAPNSNSNDPRYPVKLRESFRVLKIGSSRQVITTAPQKFTWTNSGAQPTTFGTGYMFPRKKKALYWEGARHPVAYLEGLKGITGTHWADAVINRYLPGTVALTDSTDEIAKSTADWWVETFTNLNNAIEHYRTVAPNRLSMFGSISRARLFGDLMQQTGHDISMT